MPATRLRRAKSTQLRPSAAARKSEKGSRSIHLAPWYGLKEWARREDGGNFSQRGSGEGKLIGNSIESLPFRPSSAFVSRTFLKTRELDSPQRARGIWFERAGIQRAVHAATAFSKETHGGLYSVYTPIEIDIPRKVGAQQNQLEQCIAWYILAARRNNR